jgi:hypothetical protein
MQRLLSIILIAIIFSSCGTTKKECSNEPIHSIVYAGEAKFAAWPANNGAWDWGDNHILTGLTIGDLVLKKGHNIANPKSFISRSKDGGLTWELESPANYVKDSLNPTELKEKINFKHPDFALRVSCKGYHGNNTPEGSFFYSYDRGKTWMGPYSFGSLNNAEELQGMELNARTDYIVDGKDECTVMMAAREQGDSEKSIRPFCARTTDGGLTFQFVGWVITEITKNRALMPATVRCSDNKLVTTVRIINKDEEIFTVEAHESVDNGKSWKNLGKVSDNGPWSGNPPALVKMDDGRLCCVYGHRGTCQIIARYSSDEGKTWSDEHILRDNYFRDEFDDRDLGYPRLLKLPEGKLIAIYYWANKETPNSHIAATIWKP